MRNVALPILLVSTILLNACNDRSGKSHGAIILGDSTTIVTEKDSQYLKDLVTDFKPIIPEEAPPADTAHTAPAPDTARKVDAAAMTTATTTQPTSENGLTVAFNEATVFIPGITTKSYHHQDPKKGHGVSYQLTAGILNNNHIKVTAGNVTKVWQHYQTAVIIHNSLGTLQLDALTTTTEWEELKGANGNYTISGLDGRNLEYSDANNAEIRKALERALRAHRVSKRKHAEWMNSIHRTHNVKQAPLKVVLRSVVWKIEGKDTKGKAYQKQLRVDLP